MEEACCAKEDYRRAIQSSRTARCWSDSLWENISGKLKRCQKASLIWVKKTVQANEDLIKAKTCELAILKQEERDLEREKEKQLAEEIHGLMKQENLKWL